MPGIFPLLQPEHKPGDRAHDRLPVRLWLPVDPLNAYEDIISKKTPHPLDEWYVINGTAHVDLVIGKKTPSEVFPRVGAWLKKVIASQ